MATDAMKAAPGVSLEQQPKIYGLLPVVLFAVSAMITLDTVATSAAIGVQGLTFFILGALFFYIPYGFVTAELGSAWPEEGGISVWIREAYGERGRRHLGVALLDQRGVLGAGGVRHLRRHARRRVLGRHEPDLGGDHRDRLDLGGRRHRHPADGVEQMGQ